MRYLFACLLALLPALDACRAPEPRLTVVLFDTSGSVHSDVLRRRYADLAGYLADTARPGDHLVADRISDHSWAEARLALSIVLPYQGRRNDVFFAQDMDALRDSIRQAADLVLDAPPASCTDLLGAFDLTARFLRGQKPDVQKRLVVASDMVQTCGGINFRRRPLDAEAIAALIEAERAAGRLPDLTGVKVWVAGAGTDTALDAKRHAAIERFWHAYFAAAGADVAPERYAPTLLHWE